MERKQELIKLCDTMDDNCKMLILPLIDEIVYMEEQLCELRKVPLMKLETSKKDPSKTRTVLSPTFSMYRMLEQQYRMTVAAVLTAMSNNGAGTSPLREYLNKMKSEEDDE